MSNIMQYAHWEHAHYCILRQDFQGSLPSLPIVACSNQPYQLGRIRIEIRPEIAHGKDRGPGLTKSMCFTLVTYDIPDPQLVTE